MENTTKLNKLKLLQAVILMDQLVPQLLNISDSYIKRTYKRNSPKLRDHLMDKWKDKEGEIGSFYLNLDQGLKRRLLESFNIDVEPDKYQNNQQATLALLDGKDWFEVLPFQTEMLHQFLLMANNNSLVYVKTFPSGDLLNKHLKASNIDTFGTGENWCKFYQYLFVNDVKERKQIVECAFLY